LTIATEFIGVSLALEYFGISEYIAVPICRRRSDSHDGLRQLSPLGAFHVRLRVRQLLVIPLAIFSHPKADLSARTGRPGVKGGFNSTSVLLIIAIVGTTVAPWQLFFQQSNIIDKRITPRWINYERVDTVHRVTRRGLRCGDLDSGARRRFAGTPLFGHFTDALGVARGFQHYVGHGTGAIFAIILLNAVDHRRGGSHAVHLAMPSVTSSAPGTRSIVRGATPSSSTARSQGWWLLPRD
jgi:Mn2+/Fe2+ NRAMP family transporter